MKKKSIKKRILMDSNPELMDLIVEFYDKYV